MAPSPVQPVSGTPDVPTCHYYQAPTPATGSAFAERGCFVFVSTEEGQCLNIQYGESTGSGDTGEVACEKARSPAAPAMQTLLTQR